LREEGNLPSAEIAGCAWSEAPVDRRIAETKIKAEQLRAFRS
jgi:hypothetical protein